MTAYVSCRGLGLGYGAMQTLIHLALTSEYDTEVIAVDALLEGYKAPRLDLDSLDWGARPEPVRWTLALKEPCLALCQFASPSYRGSAATGPAHA